MAVKLIPDDGPVQIRWQDNRTHSLFDVDGGRLRMTFEKVWGT